MICAKLHSFTTAVTKVTLKPLLQFPGHPLYRGFGWWIHIGEDLLTTVPINAGGKSSKCFLEGKCNIPQI